MFRQRSGDEHETSSEAGVRHLFALGPYQFRDTIDGEGRLHHFIRESSAGGAEPQIYEVDRETMYEFMARFLAGQYEMEEYGLEHSPGHDELLDVLEIASARARGGESEFSWEEFEVAETEVLDEDDADEQP
jgi:hypothetical protein